MCRERGEHAVDGVGDVLREGDGDSGVDGRQDTVVEKRQDGLEYQHKRSVECVQYMLASACTDVDVLFPPCEKDIDLV